MRRFFPALALFAMVTLPMAIAGDKPVPLASGESSSSQPCFGPREVRVVRLQHAEAIGVSQLMHIFAQFSLPGGPLTAIADEATNSVLLSGSTDVIKQAQDVIAAVDQAPVRGRQTRLIRLKHADATSLAKLLYEVVDAQAPRRARGDRAGVTMDRRTNTLVITSSAVDFETLRGIVEPLDVPCAEDNGANKTPEKPDSDL